MSAARRADIERIYRAAVERVDARRVVQESLKVSSQHLHVMDLSLPRSDIGIYAIAIGKAAIPMIDGALHELGSAFTAGIAVTKAGSLDDRRVRVYAGSHPVPDTRSLKAGDALLDFARQVPEGAIVLCLISGGGSALVESLRDGVTLVQLRDTTQALLLAGASIGELNAVRSRLSRIKAGGLLSALAHACVVNLIVSDVLGDDLRTIASGPTVPALTADPEGVLRGFGLGYSLPRDDAGAPLSMPPSFVLANVSLSVDAAAAAARSCGYEPFVLTRSVDGEARHVGRMIAGIVTDAVDGRSSVGRGVCLLAGGETVVTVRGDGVGGRNTEAALAAAIRLQGVADVTIGFLATDGDDATTGAAGAIVDGETLRPDQLPAAREALDANDSWTLLQEAGATWSPGPSGTNVNDLVIALIGQPQR